MQIMEQDGGKVLLVPGVRPVPVRESLLDIVEDTKQLTRAEHVLIIQEQSIKVPEGFTGEDAEKELLHLAMSFAQNGWYEANGIGLSDPERWKRVQDGHESRLLHFADVIAKFEKAPPPKVKEPRSPREPKAPKEPKNPSTSGSSSRVGNRLYRVNPAGDVTIISNLTGFRKAVYSALQSKAEQTLTFEQVLETAKALGTVFKGADGGKNQTQYQLKELVAANLVTLL